MPNGVRSRRTTRTGTSTSQRPTRTGCPRPGGTQTFTYVVCCARGAGKCSAGPIVARVAWVQIVRHFGCHGAQPKVKLTAALDHVSRVLLGLTWLEVGRLVGTASRGRGHVFALVQCCCDSVHCAPPPPVFAAAVTEQAQTAFALAGTDMTTGCHIRGVGISTARAVCCGSGPTAAPTPRSRAAAKVRQHVRKWLRVVVTFAE